MLDILLCILFIVSSYFLGRLILRFAGLNSLPIGALSSVLEIAAGFAVMALAILLLGCIDLLYRWVAYILILIPILVSWKEIVGLLPKIRLRPTFRSMIFSNGWFSSTVLLLLAVCMIYNLIAALSPSLSGGDATVRIDIAKRFVQAHGIIRIPDIPESGLPIFTEVLYILALLLHGPILANLFQFTMGSLVLLAIFGFSRDRWGISAAVVATGIVGIAPLFGWLSSAAHAEMGLCFFQLLSILLMLEWIRRSDVRLLLLVGTSIGIALGIHHSAMITCLFLLLAFVVHSANRNMVSSNQVEMLQGIGNLALAAVVGLSPWYIHGWWASGSPVFPFFEGMLRRPEITKAFVNSVTDPSTVGGSIGDLVMLPWNVLISGGGFLGVIGPGLAILIPCLLLIERWTSEVKVLLSYSIFYILLWWVLVNDSGFVIPALAASALAAGWVYREIVTSQSNQLLQRAFSILMFVSLFLVRLDVGASENEQAQLNWPRVKATLSRVGSDSYISGSLGGAWDTIQYMNQRLPGKAKVLSINESCELYCKREMVQGDYLGLFGAGKKPEQRYNDLKKMGITHVLYITKPGSLSAGDITEDTSSGILKSLYSSRGAQLLAIQYEAVNGHRKGQGSKNGKHQHHNSDMQPAGSTPRVPGSPVFGGPRELQMRGNRRQ